MFHKTASTVGERKACRKKKKKEIWKKRQHWFLLALVLEKALLHEMDSHMKGHTHKQKRISHPSYKCYREQRQLWQAL
jgi:hypothetical protein